MPISQEHSNNYNYSLDLNALGCKQSRVDASTDMPRIPNGIVCCMDSKHPYIKFDLSLAMGRRKAFEQVLDRASARSGVVVPGSTRFSKRELWQG